MPTKDKTKVVSHLTAPAAIEAREEFRNSIGNLSGRWHRTGAGITLGHGSQYPLNEYERGVLADHKEAAPIYVVYSFLTPIAWWTEAHGWYKVRQRFSVITSTKHQSRLYLID